MLIQTVLIIIDRSAVVLVRFYVVGIMQQSPVSGGSDIYEVFAFGKTGKLGL